MSIIVLGSINMDVVSRVTTHPQPGETIKGADFMYLPGGKGSNQAIAAHRLSGNVRLVGKIGEDAFAAALLDFYDAERLATDNIIRSAEAPTGAAFVAVDDVAENVIYVSGGTNDSLAESDVANVTLDKDDIVSATCETPLVTTKALFTAARAAGSTTVLNAAPALPEAAALFPLCDYLIVNETELTTFANKTVHTIEEAIVAMSQVDGPTTIITTLGSQGAVATQEGKPFTVPGHKVKAVDTTGAGDCFVGAFVVALSEKLSLSEALQFANQAAARSVQTVGASAAMPRRSDIT